VLGHTFCPKELAVKGLSPIARLGLLWRRVPPAKFARMGGNMLTGGVF